MPQNGWFVLHVDKGSYKKIFLADFFLPQTIAQLQGGFCPESGNYPSLIILVPAGCLTPKETV